MPSTTITIMTAREGTDDKILVVDGIAKDLKFPRVASTHPTDPNLSVPDRETNS